MSLDYARLAYCELLRVLLLSSSVISWNWFSSLWRTSPTMAQAATFLRSLDHTQLDTLSVGLQWTSDQPVAETATYKTNTREEQPYPKRDSNPRSQRHSSADLCLRPPGHGDRKWACYLPRCIYGVTGWALQCCALVVSKSDAFFVR